MAAKFGQCRECVVRQNDPSEKRLYGCKFCGIRFCHRHSKPRLAYIPTLKRSRDPAWEKLLGQQPKDGRGHPDFQYTKDRLVILEIEQREMQNGISRFLDSKKYPVYSSDFDIKPFEEPTVSTKDQELMQVPKSPPSEKNAYKIGLVVSVIIIAFLVVSTLWLFSAYARVQEEILEMQTQTNYAYDQGYDEGYIQGLNEKGFTVRDPTYQEAMEFLASDQTEKNEYDEETYTCWNYAADFKNNSFEVGYRCGYVDIEFPDSAHAIVCFNTTNYGIIFIEPQSDEIVTPEIGEQYWDRTKYEPLYDDTIVRIFIIW